MPQITQAEFKERHEQAMPLFGQLLDFLHHEAVERVRNRSWGNTQVILHWEDGRLECIELVPKHTIRRGKLGNLPGVKEKHLTDQEDPP